MSDSTDQQLLRDYAECGSETAFAELVRRHVDFVYSAALRMVCNTHLAEDVAQAVFVALAKNARQLVGCIALEGWLHNATRNLAANAVRTEVRRRDREQEAAVMNEMLSNDADVKWEHIAPYLDEALGELSEPERDALMLRYFKNHDFRAVGSILGISDDTAQKRVSRAVEKLREYFIKRKISIGVGGLVALISANAVQSAPIGLAVSISAAALAGKAVTTSTLIVATTKTIAMTALQKTLVTATVVVLAGAGFYETKKAHDARIEVQMLQQQQAPLAEQIRRLQRELDAATNQMESMAQEIAKNKSNNLELLKLRGKVTQLQNASANTASVQNDPAFQKASEWLAKEAELREQFEQRPDQWIPEMKYLSREEWLDQARRADLNTASGMRCAMSNVRVAAIYKFAQNISEALTKYLIAHNQQLPESTSELSAYLPASISDAGTILARYEMLNSETQTNPIYEGFAMIEKSVVDHIESPVLIGAKTVGSVPQPTWPSVLPNELMPIVDAYKDANNKEGFLSIYDLKPYATTPEQKAALNKFINSATRPQS